MPAGNKPSRSATNNSEEGSSNSDTATEILISKVCANFANQLEIKMNKQFEKLENKMSEVTDSIKSLNDKIDSNSKAITCIQEKCDYTEQYLKRNALRFQGLHEIDGEGTCDVIVAFINTKLKVPCSIRDIDYVFRLGNYDNSAVKPRSILVNFVQNIKRNEVFSAKKLLKNSDFAIFEDLTPRRYELLVAAKKKFGKNKVWSAGGKVYLWNDKINKKSIINSMNDLFANK